MNVLRRIPYLTITAGLISMFVSLAMWRTPDCDAPGYYRFGSGDIEFIYAGGYWKIFIASFLHNGLPHLIGNLVFLWLLGSRIELEFGRRIWLTLYLVSEFVARLSVGVVVGLSSVGISGFIFGMFGYLLVADWRESLWRTLISRKVYIFFGIFIGMTIIPPPDFLGLPAPGDVAHEAHLTGFLQGLLLGNFILRCQTVWAGLAAAILPLAAFSTLLYFPSSFWWQMAKDNEQEVLAWQNMELLSCKTPNASGTDELPKYAPVIINPARMPYTVISPEGMARHNPPNSSSSITRLWPSTPRQTQARNTRIWPIPTLGRCSKSAMKPGTASAGSSVEYVKHRTNWRFQVDMKSLDVYISSGGKNDPQPIDRFAYPDWQRAPGLVQYQAEQPNAAGKYAESGLRAL